MKEKMDSQWYAIKTKPQKELYAGRQFDNQGFEVYIPMTLVRRTHARRVEWVERPYLPGYLFLLLSAELFPRTQIRSTYGAIDAVHFGDNYPPVPPQVISAMKHMEDDRGLILLSSNPKTPFQKAERVVVTDGPFAHYEAIFLQQRGKDRVTVLIDLLERQVKVNIKANILKSA